MRRSSSKTAKRKAYIVNGKVIKARNVVSNATIWDTVPMLETRRF